MVQTASGRYRCLFIDLWVEICGWRKTILLVYIKKEPNL